MSLKLLRRKYIYSSFNLVVLLMILVFSALNIIRINDNIKIPGVIKSKDITYIKSPCDTYLKEIYVVPGEEVKQGQLLARLDDMGIRTYIQNLKSELIDAQNRKSVLLNEMNTIPCQLVNYEQDIAQCKSKLVYAQALYESNAKLYQNGAISALDFKNSEQNYDNLRTDLVKYENNLRMYKLTTRDTLEKDEAEIRMLDSKTERINSQLAILHTQFLNAENGSGNPCIIAPCAGVISAIGNKDDSSDNGDDSTKQKNNFIGKTFAVNETIFEISNPKDIYIESTISENNFPFVFEGDKASITIPAYPYAEYGILSGFIQKLYKEPTTLAGSTVYQCEIKIVNVNANKDIKAYLGLTTQNTIDVKSSYSLIDYMLKKIFYDH